MNLLGHSAIISENSTEAFLYLKKQEREDQESTDTVVLEPNTGSWSTIEVDSAILSRLIFKSDFYQRYVIVNCESFSKAIWDKFLIILERVVNYEVIFISNDASLIPNPIKGRLKEVVSIAWSKESGFIDGSSMALLTDNSILLDRYKKLIESLESESINPASRALEGARFLEDFLKEFSKIHGLADSERRRYGKSYMRYLREIRHEYLKKEASLEKLSFFEDNTVDFNEKIGYNMRYEQLIFRLLVEKIV